MMPCEVPNVDRVCLRWTIGNVRPRGFEMLRLSIACAAQLFGPEAHYVVCVNSMAADDAQRRTGALPIDVEWRHIPLAEIPLFLRAHLDVGLCEGTGWKFAPLRLEDDRYELALDNDCILWKLPDGIRRWLRSERGGVLAEDVTRCLGSFDAVCPPGAYNSGIRGLAPGCDWEGALHGALNEAHAEAGDRLQLFTELDEQGLQSAAMFRCDPLHLVSTREVSICSPFWPRSPAFGACGAHFVGMNSPHTAWDYYDRPADLWLDEHWARCRPRLYAIAGIALPDERPDIGRLAADELERTAA